MFFGVLVGAGQHDVSFSFPAIGDKYLGSVQQPAVAVTGGGFEHLHVSPIPANVTCNANGVNQSNIQFPCNNGSRYQSPTGDGDDAMPRPPIDQAPGEGPGVPV